MNAPAQPGRGGGVGWLTRVGFGLGEAGESMAGVPINGLLLFYLTDTLGLRPALAGLVIGLPKIWDLLIDPWLGGFVDRLGRRAGRRAPVALAAGACYAGAVGLLFSLPALGQAWVTAAVSVLLLMLWSTTQTAMDVSRYAAADDVTADTADRTGLLATAGVFSVVLGLAATASVPLLQKWGGGGQAGYARMADTIAVASLLAFGLFALTTWKYRVRPVAASTEAAAALPLWRALHAATANRGFMLLLGGLIAVGITGGITGAFMPYANRYVLHGDQANLAVLMSIVLISTLAALPLGAILARRHGMQPVLRLGSLTASGAFLLLFLASYGPAWLTWLGVALFGLGMGALAVLLQSCTLDLARLPVRGGVILPLGTYLGILVAGQKLGQSAGGFAAGLILDAIGFVSGAQAQAPATVAMLRVGYSLVPFFLMLLATLFLRRIDTRPPLTEPDPA